MASAMVYQNPVDTNQAQVKKKPQLEKGVVIAPSEDMVKNDALKTVKKAETCEKNMDYNYSSITPQDIARLVGGIFSSDFELGKKCAKKMDDIAFWKTGIYSTELKNRLIAGLAMPRTCEPCTDALKSIFGSGRSIASPQQLDAMLDLAISTNNTDIIGIVTTLALSQPAAFNDARIERLISNFHDMPALGDAIGALAKNTPIGKKCLDALFAELDNYPYECLRGIELAARLVEKPDAAMFTDERVDKIIGIMKDSWNDSPVSTLAELAIKGICTDKIKKSLLAEGTKKLARNRDEFIATMANLGLNTIARKAPALLSSEDVDSIIGSMPNDPGIVSSIMHTLIEKNRFAEKCFNTLTAGLGNKKTAENCAAELGSLAGYDKSYGRRAFNSLVAGLGQETSKDACIEELKKIEENQYIDPKIAKRAKQALKEAQ